MIHRVPSCRGKMFFKFFEMVAFLLFGMWTVLDNKERGAVALEPEPVRLHNQAPKTPKTPDLTGLYCIESDSIYHPG